jgi:23S rRNA (cytidine1920-2'-O)/16S rRNA (cytidine1409-2'-O)-methyltransferase
MSAEKPSRERADTLLCARGLAASRAKAQSLILAGEVFCSGARVDKPGQLLDARSELTVTPRRRFVSRGGDKLEAALAAFGPQLIELSGAVVVDVGSSTGGFTDCVLQRGARKVYAVDVGWGQLDGRLRDDPRVVVRERTNARGLRAGDFDEPVDVVVVDASFIGIDKLAPAIAAMLRPGGLLVALVKPQFEVGREEARRVRGVVRDEAQRGRAIDSAREALQRAGFSIVSAVDSELRGPKGNLEHFVLATRAQAGGREGG